nr:MAG: hypothetical protein [Bacteriophage sp.]
MKKATKDQIIKWYEDGLTVDEFAPLVPQCCNRKLKPSSRNTERRRNGND